MTLAGVSWGCAAGGSWTDLGALNGRTFLTAERVRKYRFRGAEPARNTLFLAAEEQVAQGDDGQQIKLKHDVAPWVDGLVRHYRDQPCKLLAATEEQA